MYDFDLHARFFKSVTEAWVNYATAGMAALGMWHSQFANATGERLEPAKPSPEPAASNPFAWWLNAFTPNTPSARASAPATTPSYADPFSWWLDAFTPNTPSARASAPATTPSAWQVDQEARDFITDNGYEEYMHAFGHLLGRVAHDGATVLGPQWERYTGMCDLPVEAGNVFTLEPHVVIPNRGIMSRKRMSSSPPMVLNTSVTPKPPCVTFANDGWFSPLVTRLRLVDICQEPVAGYGFLPVTLILSGYDIFTLPTPNLLKSIAIPNISQYSNLSKSIKPNDCKAALLRSGNSGSVYFVVNGKTYGPAAPGPQVVKNVALSQGALLQKYAEAVPADDADLARIVNVAQADTGVLPAS